VWVVRVRRSPSGLASMNPTKHSTEGVTILQTEAGTLAAPPRPIAASENAWREARDERSEPRGLARVLFDAAPETLVALSATIQRVSASFGHSAASAFNVRPRTPSGFCREAASGPAQTSARPSEAHTDSAAPTASQTVVVARGVCARMQ
jgi:hypothetical protein